MAKIGTSPTKINYILFTNAAEPATPASNELRLFANGDDLGIKRDDGVVYNFISDNPQTSAKNVIDVGSNDVIPLTIDRENTHTESLLEFAENGTGLSAFDKNAKLVLGDVTIPTVSGTTPYLYMTNDSGDADLLIDASVDAGVGFLFEDALKWRIRNDASGAGENHALIFSAGATTPYNLTLMPGGSVGIGMDDPTAGLEVLPANASTIGLMVTGRLSQSADYFQLVNNSASVLARFNELGYLGLGIDPSAGNVLNVQSSGASTSPLNIVMSAGFGTAELVEDGSSNPNLSLYNAAGNEGARLESAANGTSHVLGKMGVGTDSIDTCAELEVDSTDGGILFPRMTTAQRDAISTPTEGLAVYNTTTDTFDGYQASAWGAIGGARTLIASASGAAASYSFTSIPGTYKHLMLEWTLRITGTISSRVVYARYNNDTGANYWTAYMSTSAALAQGSSNTSSFYAGYACADSASVANGMGVATAIIHNYTQAHLKSFVYNGGVTHALAFPGTRTAHGYGAWNNTSAINRIDIIAPTGTFTSTPLSRVDLYGIS